MTSWRPGILVRALVAAALTGLILWRSDPGDVVAALAHARWPLVLGAVALVVVDRALMACRWLLLLAPIDGASRPPALVVLRIFFVSTFLGTFLPASVGGDAVRAYGLSREHVAGSIALASVLVDRLLGVAALLAVGAAGLVLLPDAVASPGVRFGWAGASAVLAAAALAAVSSDAVASLGARVAGFIPWARGRTPAVRLASAVARYRHHGREVTLVLIASLVVQALRVLQAWLLGLSLGIPAGPVTYFAFVPVIMLVMMLPITINGIGTSQAAFVWFFREAGVAAPDAFALSVLFLGLGVVGNLPGGLLYLTGARRTVR